MRPQKFSERAGELETEGNVGIDGPVEGSPDIVPLQQRDELIERVVVVLAQMRTSNDGEHELRVSSVNGIGFTCRIELLGRELPNRLESMEYREPCGVTMRTSRL